MTKFVIIAAPRSGSTHLVNVLCRHPEVACHGEVFAKKRVLFWGAGAEQNSAKAGPPPDPMQQAPAGAVTLVGDLGAWRLYRRETPSSSP